VRTVGLFWRRLIRLTDLVIHAFIGLEWMLSVRPDEALSRPVALAFCWWHLKALKTLPVNAFEGSDFWGFVR
jgi:hypothetical protein